MKVGYVRCSSADQNPARQEQILKDLGCEKVFSDMLSGNTDNVRSAIYNILYFHHKDNIIFNY